MKNINNIDELFRKGLERQYPFDEGLWDAVEAQLPGSDVKSTPFWKFNLNTILVVLTILSCSFILKDNSRKNSSTTSSQLSNSELKTAHNIFETINTPQQTAITSPTVEIQSTTKTIKNTVIEDNPNNNALDSYSKNSTIRSSQPSNTVGFFNSNKIARNTKEVSKPFKLQKTQLSNVLNRMKRNDSLVDLGSAIPKSEYRMLVNCLKYDLPLKASRYIEFEALNSVAIKKDLLGTDNAFISQKELGEEAINQRSIGLNLIYQKKFFTYGAGIQQSVYTERFKYNIDVEKTRLILNYDTTYSVVSGNFNSNGTPVLLIQQNIEETETEEQYTGKSNVLGRNTIKRIGVPLFVGLHKNLGNWSTQVRVNLIPQFIQSSSGNYLANDLNSLEPISDHTLTKVLISNRNDFKLGYNVHEQFAIGINYSWWKDLNSFTTNHNSKSTAHLGGVWLIWKP